MRTVLCLTNFFKGHRLLDAFQKLGCRTLLVGTTRVRHDRWSTQQVDEKFFVHDFVDQAALLNGISYLARDREIDLVVPLEEYAVDTASLVRAHLGLPGLSEGVTRRCRDKLAMRVAARDAGIPVPPFCPFINRAALSRFLAEVPGPWMIKPRSAGGSLRIQKLHHPDEVQKVFEELGDRRSHYLIEAYVPGQVHHVESIVHGGRVVFACVGQYGTPPFEVWNGGGVFTSRTVAPTSKLHGMLIDMNEKVVAALGICQGVNHCEFLSLGERVYFLEIGARVAGSHLDRLTTAATGVDLFVESARLELDWLQGNYSLPPVYRKEAGIALCLSRHRLPGSEFCADLPELVWTLQQEHHAGCTVASAQSQRVDELLSLIGEELERDHLAVMPAPQDG